MSEWTWRFEDKMFDVHLPVVIWCAPGNHRWRANHTWDAGGTIRTLAHPSITLKAQPIKINVTSSSVHTRQKLEDDWLHWALIQPISGLLRNSYCPSGNGWLSCYHMIANGPITSLLSYFLRLCVWWCWRCRWRWAEICQVWRGL